MKESIRLAQKAFSEGEVPVGAIVVKNDNIIGRGCSRVGRGHNRAHNSNWACDFCHTVGRIIRNYSVSFCVRDVAQQAEGFAMIFCDFIVDIAQAGGLYRQLC